MIDILFERVEAVRKDQMEQFLKRASDENGIDTSQLYLGYLVNESTGESEYKLLTDCSFREPHNVWYFDIISKLAFGIKGGFSGVAAQDNKGLCVEETPNLEKIVNRSRMSYEELENFINDYNEEKKKKKNL